MNLKYFKYVLVFLSLISFSAYADSSPLEMVQTTSEQVIAQLKQNQATLKSNRQIVYNIVNQTLLPHVDLTSMSRTAMGRDGWQKATPEQREQFTQEFTKLLVHTYAAALAQFTDEKIEFAPMRGASGGHAQVYSTIVRSGGPAIHVSYRLATEGGEWKLYDFSVDGVSMIESFRSQFAAELQQSGVSGLIDKLKQHNVESNRD